MTGARTAAALRRWIGDNAATVVLTHPDRQSIYATVGAPEPARANLIGYAARLRRGRWHIVVAATHRYTYRRRSAGRLLQALAESALALRRSA